MDAAGVSRNLKMERYSLEDRILLVKLFYKSDENVTLALRKWSTTFKNRPKPSPTMVKKLIARFEKNGSIADDHEAKKTKQRTARTPEIIEHTRELTIQNPRISLHQLASRMGISKTSAWRIMRDDLKNFPYKIQMHQRLTDSAVEKRLSFAAECCQLIDEGLLDVDRIIFSDEAHFWLDGYVNRQNYRIWGSEKPDIIQTKPLHPKKLTVWCGLSAKGIIGPIFIETSIDGEIYHDLLTDQVIPHLQEHNWIEGHYFQQDGAPPHTTRSNLDLLFETFGDRVIARGFPEAFEVGMQWPPYSPDLSPLDFFLWGYVKDQVYKSPPKNLTELRHEIEIIIKNIEPNFLHRAVQSFEKRLRYLISVEGSHVENIVH